jgi:hypothetical protein
MLKRFSSVLLENSSKRALASLIVTVSVEIAARQDTSSTSENREVLEQLLRIHDALTYSWTRVNNFCSPEVYVESFDAHSLTLPKLLKRILDARVNNFRVGIMSDLEFPLFESAFARREKMEATEQALVLVAA